MTQVYFHCSNNTDRVLLNYDYDYDDAEVAGLTEARERVRALIAAPGPEDGCDWLLHIRDDLGEELFSLPFKALMGPLH